MQMNQTLQHMEAGSTVRCPTCFTTRLYRLADGRFKCSLCRRVFSCGDNRHIKLSVKTRHALVSAFLNMMGTTETATALQLNIKTVQKYFAILREASAQWSRSAVTEQFGTETIAAYRFDSFPMRDACGRQAVPVAAVKQSDGQFYILIADYELKQEQNQVPVDGWLYAQDSESLHKLNLDRICCQTLGDGMEYSTESLISFWSSVKKGLYHYQGGFRHNFNHFLREMEFRYNDRKLQHGYDLCLNRLSVE